MGMDSNSKEMLGSSLHPTTPNHIPLNQSCLDHCRVGIRHTLSLIVNYLNVCMDVLGAWIETSLLSTT